MRPLLTLLAVTIKDKALVIIHEATVNITCKDEGMHFKRGNYKYPGTSFYVDRLSYILIFIALVSLLRAVLFKLSRLLLILYHSSSLVVYIFLFPFALEICFK